MESPATVPKGYKYARPRQQGSRKAPDPLYRLQFRITSGVGDCVAVAVGDGVNDCVEETVVPGTKHTPR